MSEVYHTFLFDFLSFTIYPLAGQEYFCLIIFIVHNLYSYGLGVFFFAFFFVFSFTVYTFTSQESLFCDFSGFVIHGLYSCRLGVFLFGDFFL